MMRLSFLFFGIAHASTSTTTPGSTSTPITTTSSTTTTASTTTAGSTTTTAGTTTAGNTYNVVCDAAGQNWCTAAQQAWGECTCDGSELKCTGAGAAKCMPGADSMYNCKCSNGPAPSQCTAEWNMGCAPGVVGSIPCCKNLQCQTSDNKSGQCIAMNPDAPSANPYQPQQLNEQGWNIGCTSKISTDNGLTQFFYVKGDSLVDGKAVDIKQFIKGADGATDLQLGICTKECKADSDCPAVKGTTNTCLQVAADLKICASTGTCLSGMVKGDKMCVNLNPFHYGKNKLNFKTYFPVPNATHQGYHSQQWDTSKDASSYLPLWLSNWIGGILLGHMLEQKWNWPLTKNTDVKKEYVYGTLFGQLFQESAPSTNPADIKNNIINPDPTLLNSGQGGPYQLNDYSKQLPPNTDGAYGMVNYNALYHAMGYTVEEQNSSGPDSQTAKKGPKVLNSVDKGPMVAAYFHFNDINRYDVIQHQSYNVGSQAAKDWTACKANIEAGKFKHPDMMLNVVYNAGPYNSFAQMVFNICANIEKYPEPMKDLLDYSLDDDQFVAKFSEFANKPVAGTSYILYPRQINYYVDQFTNDNIAQYERNGAFSDINVAFTLQDVVDQFMKSFEGLGYKATSGDYELLDADILKKYQPSGDLTKQLSFSSPDDRQTFYSFTENWIQALETAQGFQFSDATECNQTVGKTLVDQCAPPRPTCDASFPKTWDNLCSCVEDPKTKEMNMHCSSDKITKSVEKYHCTCKKSTGTTTAAPAPQKGQPCSAQNCATGLACLSEIYADGKKVYSEFRYATEKPTCLPYDQNPMIQHLVSKKAGDVADGKNCSASNDCGADSVCVQAGVWIGSDQVSAECRDGTDSDCKCVKASDTDDELVKKYLAHESRRMDIFV